MVATFGNKNYLGGYLSYLFLPAVGLMVLAKLRWVKLTFLLTLSLVFAALLALRQDAVWVSLLAAGALAVVGVRWGRLGPLVRRNRAWLLGLFGAFLGIFLVMNVFFGQVEEAVPEEGISLEELFAEASRPFTDRSARIRLFDWQIGLEMARDRPVLGVGLGEYKLSYLPHKAQVWAEGWTQEFADSHVPPAAQAHNDYLQWAAETGILGLLALFFVLGHLAWMGLWGFLRDPMPTCRFLRLAVLAGLGTVGAHAFVDFPFHLPASALATAALVGVLYSPFLNERTWGVGRWGVAWKRFDVRIPLAVGLATLALLLGTLGVREFQANAHMQRAISLVLEWGDFKGAEQVLERSVALSLAPAHNALLLGAIYFMDGRYRESLPLFEAATRGRPSEMAYFLLGQAYLMAGEREEGRKILEELLKMRPRPGIAAEAYRFWELAASPWASELLALQRLTAQRRYDAAAQEIERLLGDPLDPQTRQELRRIQANLALRQGNSSEARRLIEQALQEDPQDLWFALRLAQITVQDGASEEATQALKELRAILVAERESASAELAGTAPSPEQQILRAKLDLIQKIEDEARRLKP